MIGKPRVGRALAVLIAGAAAGVFSSGGCSCGDSATGAGGAGGHAAGGGGNGGSICPLGGTISCDGNTAIDCSSSTRTDCAKNGQVCAAPFGCVTCAPGQGTCKDGQAHSCNSDGSGYVDFTCDPVQGMTCTANGCTGTCSPAELGPSYLGCDYYPTVTLNPVWSGFDFAVAVANATEKSAKVTVTRRTSKVQTATIASGNVSILKLPWVTELKGGDVDGCQNPPDPGNTRLVMGGAYRVRADQPVTVYQFSPREYEIDPPPANCPVATECGGTDTSCKAYSADASLLLPATALTGNYNGLAWPASGLRAGFFAITGTSDGTSVVVTGKGAVAAGAGIDQNGNGTVHLDAGDVLEIVAAHDQPDTVYGADPSGTRIRADKPVQVIAGHSCANIPTATTGYCDHLEEGLFPDETLGQDYLVTYPDEIGCASPHVISISRPSRAPRCISIQRSRPTRPSVRTIRRS